MKEKHIIKVKDLLLMRSDSIAEENIDQVKTLLKELARRLLLWTQAIKENNPNLGIGSNILFDVTFAITGKRKVLPSIDSLSLSYFDKILLASYFNFLEEEKIIREMGYILNNPYEPYIEIFKIGGCLIKYEYTRLEVYPFIGINIDPREKYIIEKPFWTDKK